MIQKISASFKQNIFNLYRKSVTKKHVLNYLFWECTLRCNLNCLHCGSDCLKTSGISDMPIQDFVSVLDDIKNHDVKNLTVCITGGEPLLRKDLEVAGKEICKRGYRWGIVTNALCLSPERYTSLLNAGLSSISFSLDGLENQHEYLRRNPKSFKTVCNAIDMSVAIQKKNPHRLVFDVITCVHKDNINTLPEFRDFLISKGVKMWRIFSIFPEGRGEANEKDLSLSKEQYKQVMDFIVETRTKYKDEIHLNYSCEGYLGKYELKARDFFFFCRGGINVGSVMCDGSMSACLSVRSPDFIQGNIYGSTKDSEEKTVTTSFMEIWNNKYENLRNRSWAKKGKCASCKVWNNCLGNGLHLHHDMNCEVAHCNYELMNK